MSKMPGKVEESHAYLGITQPAGIPGIARMFFFIISVSGYVPTSARPGIDV